LDWRACRCREHWTCELERIRGSRLAELSLKNVLEIIGVQLKHDSGQYDRFKATA